VFPHKHTGEIHAFTFAGEWAYLEYPGSPILVQPPQSRTIWAGCENTPRSGSKTVSIV